MVDQVEFVELVSLVEFVVMVEFVQVEIEVLVEFEVLAGIVVLVEMIGLMVVPKFQFDSGLKEVEEQRLAFEFFENLFEQKVVAVYLLLAYEFNYNFEPLVAKEQKPYYQQVV